MDPNVSVYPDIGNAGYSNSEQQSKIKNGHVQFFPICTSKDTTSYSIKTDSWQLGLDVYFVSTFMQRERFTDSGFDHYAEPGCFGQNKQSYGGTCSNVKKGSGLLGVFPD